MDKHSYQVSLNWKEGRIGTMSSDTLPLKIEVATPPEFDKGVPGIWSPEHLFTASVLSCFMTTFLAVADYSKLEIEKLTCKAEGILQNIDGKFLMTEVILKPTINILKEEDREKTEKIILKAEKACLISNSITSKVT